MKKNRKQSIYNTVNTSNSPEQEPSAPTSQNNSPFLKGILSCSNKLYVAGNEQPEVHPDRVAALRYIKESAFVKKIFMQKMN